MVFVWFSMYKSNTFLPDLHVWACFIRNMFYMEAASHLIFVFIFAFFYQLAEMCLLQKRTKIEIDYCILLDDQESWFKTNLRIYSDLFGFADSLWFSVRFAICIWTLREVESRRIFLASAIILCIKVSFEFEMVIAMLPMKHPKWSILAFPFFLFFSYLNFSAMAMYIRLCFSEPKRKKRKLIVRAFFSLWLLRLAHTRTQRPPHTHTGTISPCQAAYTHDVHAPKKKHLSRSRSFCIWTRFNTYWHT